MKIDKVNPETPPYMIIENKFIFNKIVNLANTIIVWKLINILLNSTSLIKKLKFYYAVIGEFWEEYNKILTLTFFTFYPSDLIMLIDFFPLSGSFEIWISFCDDPVILMTH